MNIKSRFLKINRILKRREVSVLVLILLLIAIFSFLSDEYLTQRNIYSILLQVSVVAVASIGFTMIMITGGIDVSIGSILGISSVVAGHLLVAGFSAFCVILAALFTGLFFGVLNGLIISYAHVPPIITTLGMMSIIRALMFQLLNGKWITSIPKSINFLGSVTLLKLPISIWIVLALSLVATWFLYYKPTGRHIYASGNSEEASRVAGVNLNKINVLVYGCTGMLASLSGLITVARTGIVQTNTGLGFEMNVLAAVIVGGTSTRGGSGTVIGSILGAFLVVILKNGMILINAPALYEGLIIGLLIILSVIIDFFRTKEF